MKLLIKYLMEGWVKLYRKLADNPIWTCEPFTRGQAWVDLILLANHEYGYFYVRGHKIEVNRGQVGYSHLKLSERWQWSRTKVKKFLNDLEKEQQIIQQQSKSYSTITIINYEKYQEKKQQQDNRKATARHKQEELRIKEEYIYNQFYDAELENSKTKPLHKKYEIAVHFIFGIIGDSGKLQNLLKMPNQLSYKEYEKLSKKCNEENVEMKDILLAMDNWKELSKKRQNLYRTALTFIKNQR